MTRKEKVTKDIEMAFDFARYLIEHPEELDKIPDGSEIAFNDKSEVQKKSAARKSVCVDVRHAFAIKKRARSQVDRSHATSPKRQAAKSK
jgi:hypothetical protein